MSNVTNTTKTLIYLIETTYSASKLLICCIYIFDTGTLRYTHFGLSSEHAYSRDTLYSL